MVNKEWTVCDHSTYILTGACVHTCTHTHTHTTKRTIKGIPKCGYRYVLHQVKTCNTYISQMINAIVDVLHPVTWIDKHIIWQSSFLAHSLIKQMQLCYHFPQYFSTKLFGTVGPIYL